MNKINIILQDENSFLLIQDDKQVLCPIDMLNNIIENNSIDYIDIPNSLGIAKPKNDKYDLYKTNIMGRTIYSRKFDTLEELMQEAIKRITVKQLINNKEKNIEPKRKRRLFKRKK